jgi:hypothetical protein
MEQAIADDLVKLGREAAEEIAGAGSIEQVEVVPGEDAWDRPAYVFSVLINLERSGQRPGFVLIRLTQKLRDELSARGDPRYPIVHLLDQADWPKRARA